MKKRAYNWVFLVYPDSCCFSYDEMLKFFTLHSYAYVVSPLHQPDPADEYEYKPHYHVLVLYDTLKSAEQVSEIFGCLSGTSPFVCHSVVGMVRYFCHIDNPEKPQYLLSDLRCHNFNVDEVLSKPENDYNCLKNIILDLKMGFHCAGEYIDFLIKNRKIKELSYCVNRILLIDKLIGYYKDLT